MFSEETCYYTAKTFYGLEEILADELKQIGVEDLKVGNRAVTFKGDKQLMYKVNFNARTALSVLKPLSNFKATNEDELYKKIYEIEWDKIFTLKQTFAVETTVYSNTFTHSQFVGLKTKDAIVDYFRDKTGKRPFVDAENPDILINLHISEQLCNVSLNSSGESLYKRGYRVSSHDAPINEVLAAGLLKLSGWDGSTDFLDPMCGSGTMLIEAALMANNIAPGIYRKKFGFENWLDFDENLYRLVIDEAEENEKETNIDITGFDISPKAIGIARTNINNASLQNIINIKVADFFTENKPFEDGIIITNPPYGERIQKNDIVGFYKNIGNTLKQNYSGFTAWIISSNIDATKQLGLHASKRLKLLNSQLECTYNRYDIYEGSKKVTS